MKETEGPIISKWKKSPESSDEKIGEGFVSGESGKKQGVRRKTFEVPDSQKAYVYKEVLDREDADNTMRVYRAFKEAGLPVADFAKIVRKKTDNEFEYEIVMEDLSENDQYELIEAGLVDLSEVINSADGPQRLRQDMVRALALIKNLDFVHYHPGTSFAVRVEPGKEKGKFKVKDFVVLDYSNFSHIDDVEDFDERCEIQLDRLINSISSDDQKKEELRKVYSAVLKSKEKVF